MRALLNCLIAVLLVIAPSIACEYLNAHCEEQNLLKIHMSIRQVDKVDDSLGARSSNRFPTPVSFTNLLIYRPLSCTCWLI